MNIRINFTQDGNSVRNQYSICFQKNRYLYFVLARRGASRLIVSIAINARTPRLYLIYSPPYRELLKMFVNASFNVAPGILIRREIGFLINSSWILGIESLAYK